MLSRDSTMCAVVRTVWWSVTPVTGAVGIAASYLVLGTASATLLAGLVGLLAAFTGWTLRTQVPDPPPVPPPPLLGVLSAGALLAAVGLLVELGPFGLADCVATALTGWCLVRPSEHFPGASGERDRAEPPPDRSQQDLLPSVAVLATLGTADLCRVWQLTYPRLARAATAADTEHLTELRRACLAELERRNPVAFGRWLPTARAAGDPARFFCPRSSRDVTP